MDAWMGGVTGSQGKGRESGPSKKDFPTTDSSQAHKPGPTLGPQHHRSPALKREERGVLGANPHPPHSQPQQTPGCPAPGTERDEIWFDQNVNLA